MLSNRVCMLVWNGFVHDARVTKEAETLLAHGYDVTVVAISTPERPAEAENLDSGLHVKRVRRDCRLCRRLSMLPRAMWRVIWAREADSPRASDEHDPWSGTSAKISWREAATSRIVEMVVNWRLFRAAVAARPAVVHAHDVNVLVPAWLASRVLRAKLVYDAHEISADREGYHGVIWLIRLVERLLGKSADGFITTTDERASYFIENYGYRNALVLQNRPRYTEPLRSDRLRRACRIENPDPIVLYQGGLQWGRGLRNLVAAIDTVEHVNLVFLGNGAEEAYLEKMVTDNGLGARVYFHPTVSLDELPTFTASADIGIQTLRNTCFNHYSTDSNKLFEYIMARIPVVASNFPEIRRVVNQYSVGLLVDSDDVDAIGAAITRLATDRAFSEECRANAAKAAHALCWETQEAKLAALYNRLSAE